MNFGKALQVLKADKIVRRPEWHPDAWVMRIEEFTYPINPLNPYARAFEYLQKPTSMVTVEARMDFFDGEVFHVGWLPSQDDLMADNWDLVIGEGTTKRQHLWERDEEGQPIPLVLGRKIEKPVPSDIRTEGG